MGVGVRARELSRELVQNPFFPLLFISESVKNVTFHCLAGQPPLDVTAASLVMGVLSVVGWLYAYDDVAWGLYELANDVTEDDGT